MKNDAFTVNDTTKGNGALDHPIALLTADELTMAGSGNPGCNTQSYLYTNQIYWSLSPRTFTFDAARMFSLNNCSLNNDYTDNLRGVRPAVSLAPGTNFASGDGSANSPYKID